MEKPGKKVWKIKKGASLSLELVLVKEQRLGYDGHYMTAPVKNMPLRKYLGTIEEFGLDRSKVQLLIAESGLNVI
jgi:hypothetical protein